MNISILVRLVGIGLLLAFATGCTGNQINNPDLQYTNPSNYTGNPNNNDLFN